ncbi:MAG: N-acetylmuramoyl-L-alanine amidase [Eubacterium sp.]|nr:N-acetylmuramoyl-L-alanine amidase [Eubacterium sp.]
MMKMMREQIKIRIAAVLFAAALVLGIGIWSARPAQAAKNTGTSAVTGMVYGWDEAGTRYYANKKMLTGPQNIEGHWYYFDTKTGLVVKNGFQYIEEKNKTCYYDENGWAVFGEQKIGKYWYYFSKKTGAMRVNQFQKITAEDGTVRKCYYNKYGHRVKGEKKVGKYWYYFNTKTGAMVTDAFQLVRTKNKTCYYDEKGRRGTGNFKTADGVWYTAQKNGDTQLLVVTIDPGHQKNPNLSHDPIGPGSSITKIKVAGGATGVATGKDEYQLTLEIAKKLRAELKERGFKVVMTRTKNDVNISNRQRAKKANKANSAAYVILHADADSASATGAHTICSTSSNRWTKNLYKKSHLLAEKVINAYCEETGFRSRGVNERDDLCGINWSKVPTCFIEMGFLSNATEDRKMSSVGMQGRMAEGIANGIQEYLEESA